MTEQAEVPLSALTSRMRDGCDASWREFHRRYYLALLRYTASRATLPDDADDILQQAYLRVARHLKPFREETDFWRWLLCVVRCTILDHQRGIRRRALLLEKFAHWHAAQHRAPTEPPGLAAANSALIEALSRLPAEDAQLLRSKYCDGWSTQQLAAEANTTPKAIENRLARIRQRLRENLLRIQ